MKKIYFSLLAGLFACSAVFAQSLNVDKAYVKSVKPLPEIPHLKIFSPTDTAGWTLSGNFAPEFAGISGQVLAFAYTGGGWIYGVNISQNNINECAQGYVNFNQTQFGVGEVLMFFVGKTGVSGDPTSKAVVKVYNMDLNKANNYDPNATNEYSLNSPGPSQMLTSVDILFDDIDTNFLSFNSVVLPTPVIINGDFAVGVDFANMKTKGDTAGLLCDDIGDAGELDYAFHKISTQWFTTDFLFSGQPQAGGTGTGATDNNIAIFPVVDENYVGIDSPDFLNGMKLDHAAPNPVVESTQIRYALQNNTDDVVLQVFDSNGRIVRKYNEGNKAAGVHNINFDTVGLTAGNYYYSLIVNGNRLTKKMVIIK